MKRIFFTLCVLIALASVADAARFYKCVDSNGTVIMTDNPTQDAICEGRGSAPDLTPSQRQQIEREQASREVDRQAEAANDKIEDFINKLQNDPKSINPFTGQLRRSVRDDIIRLRALQIRNKGN